MSVSIEHDFDGLNEYLRNASKGMLKQLDLAMFRGALTLERAAKQNAPEFHSLLSNSIHSRKTAKLEYEIGTGQEYALAQEQGTRPGYWPNMRPSSDFYKWVQSVAGGGDRAVFLIGRAIFRKGTRGREYMKRAYDDNINAVIARISKAVGKGLEA